MIPISPNILSLIQTAYPFHIYRMIRVLNTCTRISNCVVHGSTSSSHIRTVNSRYNEALGTSILLRCKQSFDITEVVSINKATSGLFGG